MKLTKLGKWAVLRFDCAWCFAKRGERCKSLSSDGSQVPEESRHWEDGVHYTLRHRDGAPSRPSELALAMLEAAGEFDKLD